MLVVTRFAVPEEHAEAFRADAEQAIATLSAAAGFADATLGRNLDEPGLWTLVTRWDSVGAYRRALSSYDVKLRAVPLLSRALDEPSAYEEVHPGADLNRAAARSLG